MNKLSYAGLSRSFLDNELRFFCVFCSDLLTLHSNHGKNHTFGVSYQACCALFCDFSRIWNCGEKLVDSLGGNGALKKIFTLVDKKVCSCYLLKQILTQPMNTSVVFPTINSAAVLHSGILDLGAGCDFLVSHS